MGVELIAAGITAAAGLYSSHQQSKAMEDAAKKQAEATRKAAAEQSRLQAAQVAQTAAERAAEQARENAAAQAKLALDEMPKVEATQVDLGTEADTPEVKKSRRAEFFNTNSGAGVGSTAGLQI